MLLLLFSVNYFHYCFQSQYHQKMIPRLKTFHRHCLLQSPVWDKEENLMYYSHSEWTFAHFVHDLEWYFRIYYYLQNLHLIADIFMVMYLNIISVDIWHSSSSYMTKIFRHFKHSYFWFDCIKYYLYSYCNAIVWWGPFNSNNVG